MRAANDQVSLHIHKVSPEPSLIALKRRDVDESSGQIVYTSSCDLGTYRICEQQMIRRACTLCTVSSEPSLLVLKRRDVNEGSGLRYLSQMRAANDQASLYIYIVSLDNLPVSDKVCYPPSRKVKKNNLP